MTPKRMLQSTPPSPPGRLRESRVTSGGLMPGTLWPSPNSPRNISIRFGSSCSGLAISKAIVDLHGGILTAASEGKDRGSSFTIGLPLMNRQPPPAPVAAPSQETTELPRILLVDDHEDTNRAMK